MKKHAHVSRDPDMTVSYHSRPGNLASPRDKQELDQFHMQLQSKVETQDELTGRFSHAVTSREKERAVARKLFKQAPAAQTMAPGLQPDVLTPPEDESSNETSSGPVKVASAEIILRRCEGSLAPRVDAFLEKAAAATMTEAQRRYPELLKVAARPAPALKKRPSALPVQSGISGGSA